MSRRRLPLLVLAVAVLVAAAVLLVGRGEPAAPVAESGPAEQAAVAPTEPAAPARPLATAYVEVLSADGSSVVGAAVKVRAGFVERRGKSDESGHAELEGLPPGIAHLEVVAAGYAPAKQSQPLPEGLEAVSWTVTLVPSAEASVRGVVVSGGAPVAKALVVGSEKGKLRAGEAIFTGDDGRFVLPRDALLDEVVAFHEAFGEGRAIPGDEVVVELPASGGVSGRVLDEAGRPVAEAEVKVTLRSAPAGARRALVEAAGGGARRERLARLSSGWQKSDERGAFLVEPLAAGAAVVVASAPGKVPAYAEIDVPAGRELREVVLRLGAPVVVTGYVTDAASGDPVQGAHVDAVRLQAAEAPGFGSAVTDEDGHYRLLTAPGLRHSLSARATGYVSAQQGGVRGRAGQQLERDFELAKAREGDRRPGYRYVGIGAQLRPHDDGAVVVGVFKAGSANGALRRGDVILRVDGKWTEGLTLAEIVELIVGEPGTEVELLVKTSGSQAPERVMLPRQDVSSKG